MPDMPEGGFIDEVFVEMPFARDFRDGLERAQRASMVGVLEDAFGRVLSAMIGGSAVNAASPPYTLRLTDIFESCGVVDGRMRLVYDGDSHVDSHVDQLPHDLRPDGCWATSFAYEPDDPEAEACDRAAVDELGLCAEHRQRMVDAR